jgi:DNA segregation ATPase FtsK/SpoIIIE-like protein
MNRELKLEELLPLAIDIITETDREFCGISWLQRMLTIRYNKASDLIDLLEDKGYIASPDELGKRKILIKG